MWISSGRWCSCTTTETDRQNVRCWQRQQKWKPLCQYWFLSIGTKNFNNWGKIFLNSHTATISQNIYVLNIQPFNIENFKHTGKSLSEALILASTNPQYDKTLFIELRVQYMLCTQIVLNVKTKPKFNLCTQHVLNL